MRQVKLARVSYRRSLKQFAYWKNDDRELIDAIREVLGKAPLYDEAEHKRKAVTKYPRQVAP